MTALSRKNWKALAISSLLLAFTALTFTPLHIYTTNTIEFQFSLSQLFRICLVVSSGIALAIFLLLACLPRLFHEKGVAFVIALAVLIWAQGNLLVWHYGIFDGRDINWQNCFLFGFVDVAVWLAVLTATWFGAAFIYRQRQRIVLALALIQMISVGIDIARMPRLVGPNRYVFDRTNEFDFSPERNVLLLLLDSFQGDFFQELITVEPEWKAMFPGFTHYPNTIGAFSSTLFSLPDILTGQIYDGSALKPFIQRAFARSLPTVLSENGFRSELYPLMYHLIPYNPGIAANLIYKKEINPVEMAFLFDVALFRSLPQPAKKLIYNNQLWFLKGFFPDTDQQLTRRERKQQARTLVAQRLYKYYLYDKDFAANMSSWITTLSRQPTFKFFHLRGLHLPLRLNRDCSYQVIPFSRENALIQARCSLRNLNQILEALKKAGIYEQTMIFISGDHGLGGRGMDFRADVYSSFLGSGVSDNKLGRLKAAAMPLFLMKPFGMTASDPFSQSLAPVTLGDIPQTVFTALGIRAQVPGQAIASLTDNSQRRRRFYFGYHKDISKEKFLLDIEFQVNGLCWLDSSWRMVTETLPLKPAKDLDVAVNNPTEDSD